MGTGCQPWSAIRVVHCIKENRNELTIKYEVECKGTSMNQLQDKFTEIMNDAWSGASKELGLSGDLAIESSLSTRSGGVGGFQMAGRNDMTPGKQSTGWAVKAPGSGTPGEFNSGYKDLDGGHSKFASLKDKKEILHEPPNTNEEAALKKCCRMQGKKTAEMENGGELNERDINEQVQECIDKIEACTTSIDKHGDKIKGLHRDICSPAYFPKLFNRKTRKKCCDRHDEDCVEPLA
jgi:hypothetical protein